MAPRLLPLAVLLGAASGFGTYRASIPNGFDVERNGALWPGVGHLASAGGGALNAFGAAFVAAGRQWTQALCQADSDGDGQSNGFELGDPECIWQAGAAPVESTASHPAYSDSTKPAGTTPAPAATATTTTTVAEEAGFCPTLHADFLRRQQLTWGRAAPFNESDGAKHTPYIAINGTVATVTVGDGSPYHPMVAAPGAVHFVTHIYVLDQDGAFVALDVLDPAGADVARTTFAVPAGATSLRAYEFCNLHGLWEGPAVAVATPHVTPVGTPQGSFQHSLSALSFQNSLAAVATAAMRR